MADNVAITAGAGTTIATDDVASVHYQRVKLVDSAADSSTPIGTGAGTAASALRVELPTDGTGVVGVSGTVAHDAADSGNPLKLGAKAINHGTNPTSVTANDRTDLYANRAGVPWVIGGHPNVLTVKHTTITTAVTNAAIIAAAANVRIVVTRITATLDNASTVFPSVLIGFHATVTPTTTGVLVAHGGVPAGGGFTVGDGSGILGVGAAADALLITTTGNATGNGLQICVSYYTINEA